MDPNYCEFQQEFVMSNPISILKTRPSEASQHQITFNFSCNRKYERWIRPQDSAELQFLEDIVSPSTVEKSMCYDVPRITEFPKIKLWTEVFNGIEDFSLSYLDRWELSWAALDVAWNILAKPRPHQLNPHYHLKLHFNVMLVRRQVFEEHRYIDWVNQQGLEADHMIPATDASIDSLRSKTIEHSNEDCGSCVVCLEDFEAGCDGVVTMPCSHIFHGECITKWLRTSHYCPVCRHQMPTE